MFHRRVTITTPQFCLRGRTVAGGIKVAIGTNSNTKYGFMPSTHAEIDAIEKIKHKKNNPKKVDLLVIRLTKSGLLAESRPCYHCLCFMERSSINIKYVYYSTSNGTIAKERLFEMKSSSITCISSGMRNLKKWKE